MTIIVDESSVGDDVNEEAFLTSSDEWSGLEPLCRRGPMSGTVEEDAFSNSIILYAFATLRSSVVNNPLSTAAMIWRFVVLYE